MTSQEPLAELLRYLKAADYQFTVVTPATHATILSRPSPRPLELRDIFGWNRAFQPDDVSPAVVELLQQALALEEHDEMLRSRVRVATLGEDLLLHSAFPTDHAASVFFGPDTYRFSRFVRQRMPGLAAARRLVDMGTGSGAGAITAAKVSAFEAVTLVDINAEALRLAAINASVAGVQADTLVSDSIPEGADLIVANPPYMMDHAARAYRDGGDLLGGAVALDWASQALRLLNSGGTMLLYTGAAYLEGEAPLLKRLRNACAEANAAIKIDEIDPDVFGDELCEQVYARVERIAAVGVVISV